MKSVWVLIWTWSDRSGFGVVRAYDDEARARDDLDLVANDGTSRCYTLEKVPFWSSEPKGEWLVP
jgi:hypothetical protein